MADGVLVGCGETHAAERVLAAMEPVAINHGARALGDWFLKDSSAARLLHAVDEFTGQEADHFVACTRRDPRLELGWLA